MLNDTTFLSNAGNIDYSLLVGVDGVYPSSLAPTRADLERRCAKGARRGSHRHFGRFVPRQRVRSTGSQLTQTLAVFNTLKMVENAGKTVLKKATGSDVDAVTIQPPSDYAARLRAAMELYFVAVPEKFSRPPNVDESVEHDPRLSSVL